MNTEGLVSFEIFYDELTDLFLFVKKADAVFKEINREKFRLKLVVEVEEVHQIRRKE